jgi:hypothetical protein
MYLQQSEVVPGRCALKCRGELVGLRANPMSSQYDEVFGDTHRQFLIGNRRYDDFKSDKHPYTEGHRYETCDMILHHTSNWNAPSPNDPDILSHRTINYR